jgi:hypothetical protein
MTDRRCLTPEEYATERQVVFDVEAPEAFAARIMRQLANQGPRALSQSCRHYIAQAVSQCSIYASQTQLESVAWHAYQAWRSERVSNV